MMVAQFGVVKREVVKRSVVGSPPRLSGILIAPEPGKAGRGPVQPAPNYNNSQLNGGNNDVGTG